jgi:hypothetical protein
MSVNRNRMRYTCIRLVSAEAWCSLKAAHVGFVVKKVYLKILGLFHASWHSSIALYSSVTAYEVRIVRSSFPGDNFRFVHALLIGCCGESLSSVVIQNTSMNMCLSEPQLVLQSSK